MRLPVLLSTLVATSAIMAQFTWTPCVLPTPTLTLLALGPYGELVTILNTNPAQVEVSTDQGESWQNHPGTGGPNGAFLSDTKLHVTNAGTILIWGSVGGPYQMWRSADGGDSFSPVAAAQGVPGSSFFMGYVSGPNGDVYMYGEGILHSTDDGQNWSTIVDPSTTVFACAANANYLFGGYDDTMYRGALDGTGFAPISTGGYSVTPCTDLARVMNERIVAVGGSNKVITSTNDGGSWTSANTGISVNELSHVAGTLFNDTWVAARQNNVYRTLNAGMTWSPAPPPTPIPGNEPVLDVLCDSTGTFYIYGYSYLYRGELFAAVPGSAPPSVMSAYPNPSGGSFSIGAAYANRTCRVLDLSGRMLMELHADAGGNLHLDPLPTGRYVVDVKGTGARIDLVIER